jgi:hypothetical protein
MTLEERIDRIEAENRELRARRTSQYRRSRIAFPCVCAGLALWLLAAADAADPVPTSSNQVTAKKFVLTDDQGKIACVLTCNERGPILDFGGDKAKTRLSIFCRKDGGAGLVILDEKGEEAACIGRTSKGEAYHLVQSGGHAEDITVSENGVVSDTH